MKPLIKYIFVLALMAFAGSSFAQNSKVDDPVTQAQFELIDLQSMDKGSMTKSEKKAWKRKKRALMSFISSEQNRRLRDPYLYGNPYNPYNAARMGYAPAYYPGYYTNRPIVRYSRPVVVVRSNNNCTYPTNRRR